MTRGVLLRGFSYFGGPQMLGGGRRLEGLSETLRSHGWRSGAYRDVFTACFRQASGLLPFPRNSNISNQQKTREAELHGLSHITPTTRRRTTSARRPPAASWVSSPPAATAGADNGARRYRCALPPALQSHQPPAALTDGSGPQAGSGNPARRLPGTQSRSAADLRQSESPAGRWWRIPESPHRTGPSPCRSASA